MTGPQPDEAEALHAALRRLLEPLARLAVGRGITHAALDDWLRAAMVKAAFEAHPELPAHRRASRVSAATGLHRPEVTRLLAQRQAPSVASKSVASEVFAHWMSAKDYRKDDGTPKTIARLGAAPSFEALAQGVTRDVHPRTVLAELVRLKLASTDEAQDTVTLVADGFVPRGDEPRMAAFLGDNVGDHLSAAVENLLQGGQRHHEQAIYADGLSDPSVREFKQLVRQQWQQLTQALVPELERMVANDAAAGQGSHRIRLGMFGYDAPEDNDQPLKDQS
jgi:hypothetical protein